MWLVAQEKPREDSQSPAHFAEATDTKNDIELAIKVPRSTPAGEPISLQISLANGGKEDVTYGVSDYFCDFKISVVDADGKAVSYTRFGKACLGEEHQAFRYFYCPMPPGGKHTVEMNLGLFFDLTIPGKYRIGVAKEINPIEKNKVTLEAKGIQVVVGTPNVRVTKNDKKQE